MGDFSPISPDLESVGDNISWLLSSLWSMRPSSRFFIWTGMFIFLGTLPALINSFSAVPVKSGLINAFRTNEAESSVVEAHGKLKHFPLYSRHELKMLLLFTKIMLIVFSLHLLSVIFLGFDQVIIYLHLISHPWYINPLTDDRPEYEE